MAIFTKVGSFVKQISIYLKIGDNQKAYELSKEMAQAFPKDMVSYYLLGKSALRLENYPEAVAQGTRAYNLAKERLDSIACALLASTARFMLRQYQEGYRLLQPFEEDGSEDVEEMLLIFSAALGDAAGAAKHTKRLLKLNKNAAEALIMRFLETYKD